MIRKVIMIRPLSLVKKLFVALATAGAVETVIRLFTPVGAVEAHMDNLHIYGESTITFANQPGSIQFRAASPSTTGVCLTAFGAKGQSNAAYEIYDTSNKDDGFYALREVGSSLAVWGEKACLDISLIDLPNLDACLQKGLDKMVFPEQGDGLAVSLVQRRDHSLFCGKSSASEKQQKKVKKENDKEENVVATAPSMKGARGAIS
jgi:hypothetical protein